MAQEVDETAAVVSAQRALRELILSDPHRPTYHFVNPEGRGMPFDPNGAIYRNGKYHFMYIFQDERGHCWGHASSTDLLHWQFHPRPSIPRRANRATLATASSAEMPL